MKCLQQQDYHITRGFFVSDEVLGLARCSPHSNDNDKIHQTYYQWIPLLLMIQSTIFFIPAFVWKRSEGALLNKLCEKLGNYFATFDN